MVFEVKQLAKWSVYWLNDQCTGIAIQRYPVWFLVFLKLYFLEAFFCLFLDFFIASFLHVELYH